MRNKELFELYKEYFSKDMLNTIEWTQIKVIAIKRLKANRFKLKEIQEAIGICYKNVLKLNSREINKELDLLFDTLISEGIYPLKQSNKVTYKKL
ncbi:hypothetical protein UFOVP603_31 [uncultured Caudovirales phage]|uniref:Uncharacterized protein n=1 Tax=uncultured Caudovirales phage TaxID=2100421 RepID=A0A6J5N4D4_9CAUD|nr:hypothetical protein UFOVP603_31 [uncultured Caudovirales phage]